MLRDISVFEVIGPVMLGPSSSGTAGMARLGYAAHQFLTGPLESIDLKHHPRNDAFVGLRSHVALIGGILGMEPHDPQLRSALDLAREQGIRLSISRFEGPELPESALTVKMTMVQRDGARREVTGISVGGGSIAITEIDGFRVSLSSTAPYLFAWADRDLSGPLGKVLDGLAVSWDRQGEQYLYYVNLGRGQNQVALDRVRSLEGVSRAIVLGPFLSFGYVPHTPLVTTFAEICKRAKERGEDAFEIAMDYECGRSGRSRQGIWAEMEETLGYMKAAVEEGRKAPVQTLLHFGSGVDGQKLLRALEEGKTLSGSTLNRAVARALTTMEVACSMGRVVAAPTAGSCGIVPGCLLTVQEDRNLPDEAVVKALFVAALAGVALYYHGVSFSGMGGGCQGEIGVSCSIAAAALAYLGGGDTRQVTEACALALKNILGLICDRIGGSSEIPCIRRNGIGVANAFCAADLALAGIESYVPPDEVALALVDCQKRLPPELRGGCGGLASTPTAALARKQEAACNAEVSL